MFETAELGNRITKKQYKKLQVPLRQDLLEIQAHLRESAHSQVILVFAGVDGAGKGESVNLLNEWMDPRWLITRAFDEPADVERERPTFWRYWLALPPRGRIGMFLSSWYSPPLLEKVYGEIDTTGFDQRLERIISFENALVDDGAVVIKFWLHLSRDAQRARLKHLEKDPMTRARVTKRDWKHWEMYDDFVDAAERLIMRTSTGKAPWTIVEGADAGHRNITVGEVLRDSLRRHLEQAELEQRLRIELQAEQVVAQAGAQEAGTEAPPSGDDAPDGPPTATLSQDRTVLTLLDMSLELGKSAYQKQLLAYQSKLHQLHLEAREKGISSILVFEGPDAAGKGGAIRRITGALDARCYQVHGFAAPTDEEKAQHYLWRFWRHLSRAGRLTVFDRSWYGRVLVERVEGFAMEDEWRRAYAEINDFEEQLIEHGIVLVKFWVHITKDEQLARFNARKKTPYKRWKLTEEDWRNREKWADYALAVNDIVKYTSTRLAPWTLIEGNDKRFARVKILKTLCDRLEAAV